MTQKMSNGALDTAVRVGVPFGPWVRRENNWVNHRHPTPLFDSLSPSLPHSEERQLLHVVCEFEPRARALITAQWMTGFCISEVLSLTVHRNEAIVDKSGSCSGT